MCGGRWEWGGGGVGGGGHIPAAYHCQFICPSLPARFYRGGAGGRAGAGELVVVCGGIAMGRGGEGGSARHGVALAVHVWEAVSGWNQGHPVWQVA